MSTATTTLQTQLRHPTIEDGATMWRIARDSIRLDLNTPYAYILWARDFHATSLVLEVDGQVGGFVTGYRRPEACETLMIWQVAVDEAHRGCGLAGQLLDEVVRRSGVSSLETTITADNPASQRLFAAFAERHRATHTVTDLFTEEHFPPGQDWDAELLHRISPLRGTGRSHTTAQHQDTPHRAEELS
ncbi:diaminobutyrate acetyltransferase [Ornithinimicrobium cavernae]|uniref:diaminobutyrate acetyltransferase n=1 Tax=Ornithinimicrobium cavernae TaxID=2666047 RepID=UPI000D6984F0|nr:diaminobutyrate acetyltransferase [Ornithinimicrobium cavernae]